jgi:hypothetical protein
MPAVLFFRAEVSDFRPEGGDSICIRNVNIHWLYTVPNPEEHRLFRERFRVKLLNVQKTSVALYTGIVNVFTSVLKSVRGVTLKYNNVRKYYKVSLYLSLEWFIYLLPQGHAILKKVSLHAPVLVYVHAGNFILGDRAPDCTSGLATLLIWIPTKRNSRISYC